MKPAIRAYWRLTCLALLAAGCRETVELQEGYFLTTDLACSKDTPSDMRVAPPACPAAKGLSGDNLICVDFSTIADGPVGDPPPTKLMGWDFASFCGGRNWEIKAGKLQIFDFGNFGGGKTCGFMMPPTSDADLQKYTSFTLSIRHTVDLQSVQQKAQIMFGGDDDQQRLLDWMTGKQPRKQWTQTIAKSDFPTLAGGKFQPLFKITSGASFGSGFAGWQIESIAVMGVP